MTVKTRTSKLSGRLTVIMARKRERCKFLVERFTWGCRSNTLRKQAPKNSLFLMINDMNSRAERRIDCKCNRLMRIQPTWKKM